MSLINPTAANYLDRLSILQLKIDHGEAAGKPVDHFVRERAQVLGKLVAATPKLEHVVALTVVNARLWQAEDEMRERRAAFDPKDVSNTTLSALHAAGLCGFRIQQLNDQRASIIASINTHAGEPPTAKEKL